MMFAVYKISWTEYETGWGSRPDGESYHKNRELADTCIINHWEEEKERNGNSTPDKYSVPGSPKLVRVNEEFYKEVQKKLIVWKH